MIIITINDRSNYGNRLQNYALSRVLNAEGEGYVGTAHIYLSDSLNHGRAAARIKHIVGPLKSAAICFLRMGSRGLRRWASFDSFTKKLISPGPFLYSDNLLQQDVDDPVVLGSDQIWNYTWITESDLRMRLGAFANPRKLIAYAASIGLDDIDERWRPIFREGFSRISHISVREDRAAELVREISGREATVVLDPTLLLTCEQWSEVFTDFVPEGDRYILTYFLGSPTEVQERVIQERAHSIGARVRRLNDSRDRETYAAGPAEFVELISKAELIFTDSYHACCFSALFNRPFKVFNRSGFEGGASMNSRMRTLFRLLGLEDFMSDDLAMPEFAWDEINKLLEKRRLESASWLESALIDVAAGAGEPTDGR